MIVSAGDRSRVPCVAVVGSGPSGLYTTHELIAAGLQVDVIDRLPAPFGLIRYGVAPDHPRMKSVTQVLRQPLDSERARYLGNVTVGTDISIEDLRQAYDAVVLATGCGRDRDLGMVGESLPGSLGSGTFVGWYSGHPDRADEVPALHHSAAVVVGAGNVALDVARILVRTPEELRRTDVPDTVLSALESSAVTDVHVLIRRRPADVRFSPAELRQLATLADAEVVVHDDGVLQSVNPATADLRQRQNLDILREWSERPVEGRGRRIHLRFFRSPRAILGATRVEGVGTERTGVLDGGLGNAGPAETIEAGLVVRAIGYEALPVPGLPFDPVTRRVPNTHGRVSQGGQAIPGLYVTGWLKRGPTGVIGSNKPDGKETAAAVVTDLPGLMTERSQVLAKSRDLAHRPGLRATSWAGWRRLEEEERRLGAVRGAEQVKVPRLDSMLALARPS